MMESRQIDMKSFAFSSRVRAPSRWKSSLPFNKTPKNAKTRHTRHTESVFTGLWRPT